MDSTGIVPTMPIGGNGFGFGDSGIWLFAILALMWGGFGNNRGYDGLGYRSATAEDVNNGFNFADLQDQNRDIMNAVSAVRSSATSTMLLSVFRRLRPNSKSVAATFSALSMA